MRSPDHHLKATYRQYLAKALYAIHSYKGAEKDYQHVMEVLINLEKWLNEQFGEDSQSNLLEKATKRLPTSLEREIISQFQSRPDRTVDDLLLFTQKRLEILLNKEHPDEITFVEFDEVFFPTDQITHLGANEVNNDGTIEKPFIPKLNRLIILLQQNGIFLDDIIIIRGKVTPTMTRKYPYIIVEIPRLRKEVLICEQYGEATYIVNGILNRHYFSEHKKDRLLEDYPTRVEVVELRNREQWESDICNALFSEAIFEEKIDIRNIESVRQAIMNEVPTAKDWVDMNRSKRAKFKIGGKGLKALARVFGVNGDPGNSTKVYYELGRQIFGDDQEFNYREDEIPEQWMNRNQLAISVQGASANTIKEYLIQLAVEFPDMVKHKGNVQYFHPDIHSKCQEKFAERQYAPEGWMTIRAISEVKEIDRAYKTIETEANSLALNMEDSKRTYKDSGGHITVHYSPGLIKALIEQFNSVEKAPNGWKTCKSILGLLTLIVADKTVKNYLDGFREDHPDWFHDYLDAQNNTREHIHPELVQIVLKHFQLMEKAPEGWLTRGAIHKQTKISYKAMDKFVATYQSGHPDWVSDYLDARNQLHQHYHPELVALILQEFTKQ